MKIKKKRLRNNHALNNKYNNNCITRINFYLGTKKTYIG